jgi:hypothetical protein
MTCTYPTSARTRLHDSSKAEAGLRASAAADGYAVFIVWRHLGIVLGVVFGRTVSDALGATTWQTILIMCAVGVPLGLLFGVIGRFRRRTDSGRKRESR